jgi:hypothetical protein
MASIDDVLWRRARALLDTPDGLEILGLGVFRGDRFEPRPGGAPTGPDAPRLVVQVADELGVSDDDVRAHLRRELAQALASASEEERPAPLGALGLVDRHAGALRFHRARRQRAAPPGAIEPILAAWRADGELEERVARVVEAMRAVPGALPPDDQRRLLDDLDYDLDADGWARFGSRIVAAFPF